MHQINNDTADSVVGRVVTTRRITASKRSPPANHLSLPNAYDCCRRQAILCLRDRTDCCPAPIIAEAASHHPPTRWFLLQQKAKYGERLSALVVVEPVQFHRAPCQYSPPELLCLLQDVDDRYKQQTASRTTSLRKQLRVSMNTIMADCL